MILFLFGVIAFSYYFVKFIVCVFKCKWVDSNLGVQTDDFIFTLADLKKLTYQDEPFIMAE